jgi:hypothetical protein
MVTVICELASTVRLYYTAMNCSKTPLTPLIRRLIQRLPIATLHCPTLAESNASSGGLEHVYAASEPFDNFQSLLQEI